MINRFGLSRDDITPEIKRQLRKECGYGCVVCGSAIYQYEHIDPEFKDATVHDPSKMALLCGACHDKVTRRIWSKEKIKEARLVPYCKKLGYSFFELDTCTSKDFIIKVGETQFINLESIIVIDDVKILSLVPPDDESNQFKVSAAFFDRNNIEVAKIVENEWQGTLNAFDIETRANLIKIRSDLRRIDLKLRLMPPNVLAIESLSLSYNGVQIRGSAAKGFTIKNKKAVLKLPKQALTIEKAPFWLCIQDGKIKLGSDSVIKFLRADAKIEDLAGYTTVQDAEVSFVDPVKEGISFSPGVKPPEKMMKVTTRKAGGGIILNFPLPQPNHSKEQLLKVGRNALCPCGSGKKYKKCHGLY